MIAVMLKTSNETLTSFDVFIARCTEKTSNKDILNFAFSLGTRMFYVYCLSEDCNGNFVTHACYPSASFSILFWPSITFYFVLTFAYFVLVIQSIFILSLLKIKSISLRLCVLHTPFNILEARERLDLFRRTNPCYFIPPLFLHAYTSKQTAKAHFPACDPPQC